MITLPILCSDHGPFMRSLLYSSFWTDDKRILTQFFWVDNDFCNKYEIANPEGSSYQLCREQQTTEFWEGLYSAWHWWRLMVWLAVKTMAAFKKSKMVQSRNEADRDCVHRLELNQSLN